MGCELTDGGAAAIASALAKHQYITVLFFSKYYNNDRRYIYQTTE
jgi:hypothetical protein